MMVTLTRMKSRENGLGTRRIEVSLDDSNPIWEARISPGSVSREWCFYGIDWSILVESYSHFTICRGLRTRRLNRDLVRLSVSCTRVRISFYRSESVWEILIPVWCSNGDFLFSSSLRLCHECAIRIEVIHGAVYTDEYKEREDCWDPFHTLLTCVSLDWMFHTFTKRAK